MALELYTGTHAVDTTEWSLSTGTAGPDADTTPGEYQAFLDVSDMVAGDILQIRAYEKARSGDTQRLIQEWIMTGAQASPMWVGPNLVLINGWDFTVKALAGTITVLWSIRNTTANIVVASVAGAVGSVTAGVTVTTNNDKTGYALSAAAVSAIWAALTSALTTAGSIGKLFVDNLNAAITSRMATYSQPTGFLASTFPTTVASPTNITAGTITTVTNLTNAPTAGDLTATMKASVTTAATAATPISASVTGSVGSVAGDVSGNLIGSIGSLSIQAKADVNAEANTAIADAALATASTVTAVKAQTDKLTFTVPNQLDANIKSVNGVTVNGNGQSGTEWGP